MGTRVLKKIFVTTISVGVFGGNFAFAQSGDWGYSNSSPKKPTEMKAEPAQSLDSLAHPSKPHAAPPKPVAKSPAAGIHTTTSKKIPAKPPARAARAPITAGSAVSEWIALFDLVSKQPLTEEQKDHYKELLQKKAGGPDKVEVTSIGQFWPECSHWIEANPDQKTNFSNLFRALLRFESRGKNLDAADKEILPEVLGPEQIALPGDPPLTEESIDAYADMACFMYEQRHPGKSIDATDNRAIFASVVCNKYHEAPTEADRRAVAYFALSWSKFRIAWSAAPEDRKEQLLKSLETKAKPDSDESSRLIDVILHNGPWAKSH